MHLMQGSCVLSGPQILRFRSSEADTPSSNLEKGLHGLREWLSSRLSEKREQLMAYAGFMSLVLMPLAVPRQARP